VSGKGQDVKKATARGVGKENPKKKKKQKRKPQNDQKKLSWGCVKKTG